jgi:hypothetical protein
MIVVAIREYVYLASYQTRVSSIIHKYVSGPLKDVSEVRSKKNGGPSRT